MREMKDSGVSYIGHIPETWNITRNKNVFSCSKNIVGSESDKLQLLSLTTNYITFQYNRLKIDPEASFF